MNLCENAKSAEKGSDIIFPRGCLQKLVAPLTRKWHLLKNVQVKKGKRKTPISKCGAATQA